MVVVGASAGGVSAVGQLVAQFPRDLDATVLVVLHIPSTGPSLLAEVLRRRSALPVVTAEDGLEPAAGAIVCCTTDQHLLLVDGRIRLGHGARENGHRPSVDALFRSAALDRGPAVVGVILTGLLDDGSAGLRCVERYGGTCLVQDPEEAEFASMPASALRAVPGARVASLDPLVKELVMAVSEPHGGPAPHVDPERRRLDVAELDSALGISTRLDDGSVPGEPSSFACPDCHGVLHRIEDGDVLRFRCRTGHAWTAESLAAQHGNAVEEAVWSAVRALDERADLCRRLAARARTAGHDALVRQWQERITEAESASSTLREVLDLRVASPVPPGTDL